MVIDHPSTIREVAEFLKAYISEEGFKKYLENDKEILKRLFRELRKDQSILRYKPKMKRIRRDAYTVRAILIDWEQNRYLQEEGKKLKSGKKICSHMEDGEVWSISETVLLGEESIDCLQRALRQEMGVWITVPRLEKRAYFMRTSCSFHESSVYPEIVSHVDYDWYEVDVTGLTLRPKNHDNHMILKWKWRKYPGKRKPR